MRDFEDSTLWRISAFERQRQETGGSGFMRLGSATVLPTTLLAELRQMDALPGGTDALEVMAACLRHREAALLCLGHEGLVWPVTLFPMPMSYHAPRDLPQAFPRGIAKLELLACEPPGVRPPGHWMHERVARTEHYRPLLPLLQYMALHGPRRTLLNEIGGTAAYRVLPATGGDGALPRSGAVGSAAERLKRESAALRDIAAWPGMNVERATRLLNMLYLSSRLMVTRTHPAARTEPAASAGLFGWRGKPRR